MRAAPAGILSSPLRPIAVNRSPSTMNAAFSIGAPPSPLMSRAPSNTAVWLLTGEAAPREEEAGFRDGPPPPPCEGRAPSNPRFVVLAGGGAPRRQQHACHE